MRGSKPSGHHYLHRDYLGSILAVSNSSGKVIERAHFGAWGDEVLITTSDNATTARSDSLTGRGFTGHEHFTEVGLIHMNGRMYDAQQGRFLSPDNHIQDPFNTQNFNRFGYGFNNPLNGTEVSGEIFGFDDILIAVAIALTTNGISNTINGEGFFKNWGQAVVIGVVSAGFAYGIGEAALGIKGTFLSTGIGTISNASVFQFVAHGYLGGFMSAAQGGKFGAGFLSGGIGSAFGGKVGKWLQNARDFPKFIGTTIAGGISGGVGSRIAGGKFWDGFRNGAISAGLNHAVHELQQVNPDRLKARILKDGRLTLREANKWYRHGNGEALTVDASKVDLDFINPDNYPLDTPKGVQTLGRSRDGLVYGGITIENIGNGQLNILPDTYNFEMHNGSGFRTTFRNLATKIGGWVAGNGIPYSIEFSGVNTPNYRRNIPR